MESIKTFLQHATDYIELGGIENCQLDAMGMMNKSRTYDPTAVDALMEIQQKKSNSRAVLLSVGKQLASELETEGHDSTELLTFLHCADGGGGRDAAVKVWPSLKVQLQRILLGTGEQEEPPAGESNRTPDSKPDSQKISCPKSPELLAFIHKLKRDIVSGVRQVDVARDFADGDEKKVEKLLRGARRYKHLWQSGQTGH